MSLNRSVIKRLGDEIGLYAQTRRLAGNMGIKITVSHCAFIYQLYRLQIQLSAIR